jgi:hypothetical protein
MKITIWIHKSEAISGNITNYAFTRPYHDRNEEWVEVQISQDEFAILEDKDSSDDENLFRDEEAMIYERNPDTGEIRTMKTNPSWLVEQYNRNRDPKDWVNSVDEIKN